MASVGEWRKYQTLRQKTDKHLSAQSRTILSIKDSTSNWKEKHKDHPMPHRMAEQDQILTTVDNY
eukprot:6242044-Amphidinium_carterae.1